MLVLSLMFTLPLSALYDGRRISKTETFWSGALTVAVAVLVILGRPLPGITHPPLERWVPALAVGIIVMSGLERFAHIRPNREKALILGIVTGALFGYVAVLSKAAVEIYQYYGVIGLITNWEGYALILGATTILLQRGRAEKLSARHDHFRTHRRLQPRLHRAWRKIPGH